MPMIPLPNQTPFFPQSLLFPLIAIDFAIVILMIQRNSLYASISNC
jgi:hypothetical protein